MPDEEGTIWSFVPYTGEVRPEWLVLGKRHPDRAKQFKAFDALRGYDEKVKAVIDAARQSEGRFDPFPPEEEGGPETDGDKALKG